MKNLSITENEYREIEMYLDGELSPEDSAAFRQRMQVEEEWKEKVEQVRITTTAIREKLLETELNKIHLSNRLQSVPFRKKRSRVILITLLAAAALLLFFIVSPLVSNMMITGNEKLFSEYYHPDAGLITAMGVSDTYEFDRAMIDYKSERYKEANRRWMQLLEVDATDDTLNYFIASSFLAMGDATAAIEYFKTVAEDPGSVFYNEANWYLGLALLKTGKRDEAISYISISDNELKEKLLLDLQD